MMTKEEDFVVDNLFKMRGIYRENRFNYDRLKWGYKLFRWTMSMSLSIEKVYEISQKTIDDKKAVDLIIEIVNNQPAIVLE